MGAEFVSCCLAREMYRFQRELVTYLEVEDLFSDLTSVDYRYKNKARSFNNGSVAQLEERDVNTVKVLGSSPGRII